MNKCRLHGLIFLAGLLTAVPATAGCSKSDGGTSAPTETAKAVPGEAPTIAITGAAPTPSASASASASALALASASASASASPSASASASRTAASSSAAAKGITGAATSSAAAKDAPPLKPASTRVSGKNFTLDVASPGCRVDAPCTMTLRLAATGDYHVNKEYPYKFTASAAPGVAFLGNGDANVFSRSAGDFREDGEKNATMTVRFKPTAAGEAKVSGTYKMSVCSAENCQIEQQTVSLAVPVM